MKILDVSTRTEINLLPDSILRLVIANGKSFKTESIPNWESFEYGHQDISDHEYLTLLFKNTDVKSTVMIVTDECFVDKHAYSLSLDFIKQFITEVYPKIHGLDFFQPLDLIFVCPEMEMIVMLHHEGRIMKFKK